MNQTDYYRAGLPVLLGAFLGMSFLSLLYVVNVEMEPVEATPPKPIVEVVGTYKECEIIQYTNENLARHSYMLYCGNQK